MDLHHSSLNIFIQFQMIFSYTNDWPLGVKHWSRAMAMVGFIPLVRCSMAIARGGPQFVAVPNTFGAEDQNDQGPMAYGPWI